MQEGGIDVSPISSFSYGEHMGEYVLMPDLSISSFGRVRSIYLFTKVPIEELHQRKIAVTSSSATSVALLKILLKQYYQLDVTFETKVPNLTRMMETHDAALLIGDDAIRGYWENKRYKTYDLGELWYTFTGLPMTYAVWAVRKEILESHAPLLQRVYEAFQERKEQYALRLDKLVWKANTKFGGSPAFWYDYYKGLSYDFGEEHQRGLQMYFDLAFKLRLLSSPVVINIWEPSRK